ncbi:MAG: hypothetical protein K0R73_831 [Candidatus Midichloriaceae bacterium]|jgi:hypothetical protein|nr:hypothetical protein [Candidatus Midichloriaceae bacterium]
MTLLCELSYNLSDEQLSKILEALCDREMVTLDISGNTFGDASYEALQGIAQKSSSTLKTLRAANVCNNADIIVSLANAFPVSKSNDKKISLYALQELDLTGNGIKDVHLGKLTISLGMPKLKEFNLNNNNLTMGSIGKILQGDYKKVTVSLRSNNLVCRDDNLITLYDLNTEISTLDLSDNPGIGETQLKNLFRNLVNTAQGANSIELLFNDCKLNKEVIEKAYKWVHAPNNKRKITVNFGTDYTRDEAAVICALTAKDQNFSFRASSQPRAKGVNASVEDVPSATATKGGLFSTVMSWLGKSNNEERGSFRE